MTESSTRTSRRNAFPRAFAIPLASIIPLAAIGAAFSLGPAPEKRLEAFYQVASDQQALDVAQALGPRVLPQVAANLLRGDYPRRALSIDLLAAHGGEAATSALQALAERTEETSEIRSLALRALQRIVARGARAAAPDDPAALNAASAKGRP